MKRIALPLAAVAAGLAAAVPALAETPPPPPGPALVPAPCPPQAPPGAQCFLPPPEAAVRMPPGTVCWKDGAGVPICPPPGAPPPPSGPRPGAQAPDIPTEENPDNLEGDDEEAGRFGQGFLLPRGLLVRDWRVAGDVADVEERGGTVVVTLDGPDLVRVPRPFRAFAEEFSDGEVRILVGPRTRVVDGDGDALDADEIAEEDEIRVRARFVRLARWVDDGEGGRIPVMKASRVVLED